jgi:ornithine cyclodeaminase
VHGWDANPASAASFRSTVEALGLDYVAEADPEAVAHAADIIITVTPSQMPILQKAWIRAGTHISAMGADTKGKQELDVDLVASARLFVDEAAQATAIGEFQHAFGAGLISADALTPLGAVLDGAAPGRRSVEEITIFDGTGVALQDLVLAELAWRKALQLGAGATVDY